ncbi:hypothetical protein PRUPE_8G010800 [Prunus persica]|uniref:Uncharacterized protein n=1 Tax=Prunus persica TaxID=3760 RepID=A0A251MQY5_PRUPE|nr:hypothetical protein PRUPE_8G010800 [Prunus persica]
MKNPQSSPPSTQTSNYIKREEKKYPHTPLLMNPEAQLNRHPNPLPFPLNFPSLLRDNHPPLSSLPSNYRSSTKIFSRHPKIQPHPTHPPRFHHNRIPTTQTPPRFHHSAFHPQTLNLSLQPTIDAKNVRIFYFLFSNLLVFGICTEKEKGAESEEEMAKTEGGRGLWRNGGEEV